MRLWEIDDDSTNYDDDTFKKVYFEYLVIWWRHRNNVKSVEVFSRRRDRICKDGWKRKDEMSQVRDVYFDQIWWDGQAHRNIFWSIPKCLSSGLSVLELAVYRYDMLKSQFSCSRYSSLTRAARFRRSNQILRKGDVTSVWQFWRTREEWN